MLSQLRFFARPRLLWTALLTSPDLGTEAGRAQERHRRLVLTAGASGAARFTTIATSLITVPLTLHYLGVERYGIWIIISSFNMMLGFADMGLGNGIVNAVAHEHGQDDRIRMRSVVSSGFVAMTAIGLVILLGFGLSYQVIPWQKLFNVQTTAAIAEAGPSSAVFAVCFAMVIPLSLVQKVQTALQQGYAVGLWQCAGSLLALLGLLVVIRANGSLPWLVAALVGLPLAATLANTFWYFARAGRDLRPSLAAVSWAAMARPLKLGLQFFILQFVAAIAYGFDTMIVAQVAGADAVAGFSVPERLFAVIAVLNTVLMQPLWPAYREALSRGDDRWIRTTLKRSLIVSILASSLLATLAVLAAPTLIRWWVSGAIMPSAILLIGFGVWKVAEAAGVSTAFYFNGTDNLRIQIMLAVVAGTAMLVSKIVAVKLVGPAGIPWAGALAFTLFSLVPSGLYIRKKLSR